MSYLGQLCTHSDMFHIQLLSFSAVDRWQCLCFPGSIRYLITKLLEYSSASAHHILKSNHFTTGIIKLYSPALCQSSFEQCLNLLNHIPKNLNVEEFFECIASIAISPKHFQQELDKELIDIN